MTTAALDSDVEHYLAGQLASGAYRTREEALTAAVRTLRHQNEQARKRAALVADLEAGVRSLDAGHGVSTSAAEILAKIRADAAS